MFLHLTFLASDSLYHAVALLFLLGLLLHVCFVLLAVLASNDKWWANNKFSVFFYRPAVWEVRPEIALGDDEGEVRALSRRSWKHRSKSEKMKWTNSPSAARCNHLILPLHLTWNESILSGKKIILSQLRQLFDYLTGWSKWKVKYWREKQTRECYFFCIKLIDDYIWQTNHLIFIVAMCLACVNCRRRAKYDNRKCLKCSLMKRFESHWGVRRVVFCWHFMTINHNTTSQLGYWKMSNKSSPETSEMFYKVQVGLNKDVNFPVKFKR